MSKTVAKLVIALCFLSSLFFTKGQTRLIATQDRSVSALQKQAAPVVMVPQINKYGSLVGLRDATGKNLLKEIKHGWREGYAIAYEIKNSKGVYRDRFLYVLGGNVSAGKLKVERQKSTTSRKAVTTLDKALEIERAITWDEKSDALRSDLTVTNTSNHDVMLRAIEIDIDKRVAAWLTLKTDARPTQPYDVHPQCPVPPLGTGTILASMDCAVGDECDPCPCVTPPRCDSEPGQAIAFDRDPMNPAPVILEDLIGPKLPRFRVPMLCLYWAGSNLSRSVLKPGERILIHYRLIIPQPRK